MPGKEGPSNIQIHEPNANLVDLMQFGRSPLHAASHVIPSTASNCVCVKLRLKEVGGLHTDHLQHSFK